MTTQILPKGRSLSKLLARSSAVDQFCRTLLLSKLKDLREAYLVIREGQELHEFGDRSAELKATITVHRSSFYSRTVFGGSIGNAESYVDRDWETSELTNLIRIFVINRHITQSIDGSLSAILQPIQRLFHGFRENTLKGSRENIRAHYDIGNDFFKLFLDETMMYSSGVFNTKEESLKEASMHKLKRIGERLRLSSHHRVVEIGTGWGSLAIYLAETYGCHVTTTTISTEQYAYAQEQIKSKGLENKITLLFEDYRNLTGVYDRLVSVEMIEAVGLNHLDTYFEKCSSLLKPDGLMVLQAITIRDQFYEAAKGSVDFIQRHIFPGSGIPAVHAMMNFVTKKTDLVAIEQRDYSEDYAETLKRWSENLRGNEAKITELGYPDFLHRLWQFYFSYCEGGFRERAIGLSQMTFAKPRFKERSFV
jgi:cyclopropane-fatty-acyl-phospholipid synthase